MIPGMIVLPFTSTRVAPAGSETEADGPIAVIRLPSTITVAFSMTPGVPWIGPAAIPAIVITRAPTSATEPDGMSLFTVKPIGTPFASGSPGLPVAPSTNEKEVASSRVKSSGPRAQCSRRPSPDQCR